MNTDRDSHRHALRQRYLASEADTVRHLIQHTALTAEDRAIISSMAAEMVQQVRTQDHPSVMEKFLAEYGLTTQEGVALMCLAEALLRVPDAATIDALIEDKVVPGNWQAHLGKSASSLINSSTWALLITGKLLESHDEPGLGAQLRSLIKRLGEPVVRTAVAQAMKELGRQFVLGRDIHEATERATRLQQQGYTYSYDMLGEAARTDTDAERYHAAYAHAIDALRTQSASADIRDNPGISVKLSALHARYEVPQRERVMTELVARTLELALAAKAANIGFNIDAEEADRLDLSLDVIAAVLSDERLRGWDGFGVVVQAYGKRASDVLDWLYATAQHLDRRIMVRLVKGAYWDAEIKRAQVLGLADFPVFSRKVNTDVSYLVCAEKLLDMADRIYPQFATHNAHSVAAVLHLARQRGVEHFEYQRLHGMGEALHDSVLRSHGTRCRIYAPVGAHRDLLAYLVRRLLENGANSSFVNQIVDTRISPETIAEDPFAQVLAAGDAVRHPHIALPADIFGASRRNAKGWDITDSLTLASLNTSRDAFATQQWHAGPCMDAPVTSADTVEVHNPARPDDRVGQVTEANAADIDAAINAATLGARTWAAQDARTRADCLRRVADVYEAHAPELFALACREAGKSLLDAVNEVREAVDFARYYANDAERLADAQPRGVIACISPWNFPLAIFSGQILAALAAGNAVIAKPAEQTPLIAQRAIELMHEAGIPKSAVQLLPGPGHRVGAALTQDPRIDGVCFTGSTPTAQHIHRSIAQALTPDAPLIAETGGLNAMIVDSTALPEQVVRDVVQSAFQSAGQRCSALRMLYVQEDIAESLLTMLYGAMDELQLGDPWLHNTDIGPVIDAAAKARIDAHCADFAARGKLLKHVPIPAHGTFVAPTVLQVDGIAELQEEIFGPVLHVATFAAAELDTVVNDINAKGYGLTFGLHTRMDSRVEHIVHRMRVGNIYVNRNQIGAVVGSQPFGGEGLSGTGPKAGGPQYVQRFTRSQTHAAIAATAAPQVSPETLQAAIDTLAASTVPDDEYQAQLRALFARAPFTPPKPPADAETMPGPTGEMNLLSQCSRGRILCLGPDLASASHQAAIALSQGNAALVIAPGIEAWLSQHDPQDLPITGIDGQPDPASLTTLTGFAAVCSSAKDTQLRAIRQALAARDGALLPLITALDEVEQFVLERHLCIDTTAAGGNASLIAATE